MSNSATRDVEPSRFDDLLSAFQIATTERDLLRRFLIDIATPGERRDLENRLAAAISLADGATQSGTVAAQSISYHVVQRISRFLDGEEVSGGLRTVVEILRKQRAAESDRDETTPDAPISPESNS